MKISKAIILSCFAIASTGAFAQTLPPPSFAGQSYWYGPGPTPLSLVSTGQEDGGYAEMYQDGAFAWQSAGSGPAFVGAGSGVATFRAQTYLNVQPYIYVDGYFAVHAFITGFSAGGSFDIGTSRFFVLHNTQIRLQAEDFRNPRQGSPTGPFIPMTYDFTWSDYTNPGNFSGTGTIVGDSGDTISQDISYAADEFILQVDIKRTLSPTGPVATGSFIGTGTLRVSAI